MKLADPPLPLDIWATTPSTAQTLILTLQERIRELEARLGQDSSNSSRSPSSDPPQARAERASCAVGPQARRPTRTSGHIPRAAVGRVGGRDRGSDTGPLSALPGAASRTPRPPSGPGLATSGGGGTILAVRVTEYQMGA
jgi:hypothetical protein